MRRRFYWNQRLTFDLFDWDFSPYEAFDVGQRYSVVFTTEANSIARSTSSCGTSDSMYVIFGILGEVIVKNMAYVRNMKASRGDIRTDQNWQIT